MSLKFSPNLNIFFKDVPFPERIAKAAALGFQQVEFWGWWDEDVDAIAQAAQQNNVAIAAFCTKFVSLVDASQRAEYLAGLKETLQVAAKLDCHTLISQVGNELPGVSRAEQHASLVEGLKAAAPLLAEAGVTLVIEPLNLLVDHAGYYLSRSDEAFDVVREVDSPYVKVLFDIYHQQITEGNLISNIRKGAALIGHYHIADNPGRGEIGTGEIHYPNVLKAIAETGYMGCVGVELFPAHGSDEAALQGVLGLK